MKRESSYAHLSVFVLAFRVKGAVNRRVPGSMWLFQGPHAGKVACFESHTAGPDPANFESIGRVSYFRPISEVFELESYRS